MFDDAAFFQSSFYLGEESQIPFTNCDFKPSDVSNNPWLWETKGDCNIPKNDGKWMQFHTKGEKLNDAWDIAKHKYRCDQLYGIHTMKVSTLMENPRAGNRARGVIIFYCGPSNDEEHVMKCGYCILEQVPYNSGNMCFKSNEQTEGGTWATGQKINHLYIIRLTNGKPTKHQGKPLSESSSWDSQGKALSTSSSWDSVRSSQFSPKCQNNEVPRWEEDNWRKR